MTDKLSDAEFDRKIKASMRQYIRDAYGMFTGACDAMDYAMVWSGNLLLAGMAGFMMVAVAYWSLNSSMAQRLSDDAALLFAVLYLALIAVWTEKKAKTAAIKANVPYCRWCGEQIAWKVLLERAIADNFGAMDRHEKDRLLRKLKFLEMPASWRDARILDLYRPGYLLTKAKSFILLLLVLAGVPPLCTFFAKSAHWLPLSTYLAALTVVLFWWSGSSVLIIVRSLAWRDEDVARYENSITFGMYIMIKDLRKAWCWENRE
ncbi:hypothetical protein JKG47_01695 [Acidithiobacillus sp. MC6.1]|nr:hypothetical protein [Acidithiobacillus sp. MC6.1]